MSKTAIYIHIVFATKNRERTIFPEGKDRLYSYIAGILKNKNCHPCAIGGTRDHVHILLDLHPAVSLSTLVREIKTSTNGLIRQERLLSHFDGWGEGYYAGSISPAHKSQCEEYIGNQEEHHKSRSIEDEMEKIASRYGFCYHVNDWK